MLSIYSNYIKCQKYRSKNTTKSFIVTTQLLLPTYINKANAMSKRV